MLELRMLTIEEMRMVYEQYLIGDFPADEVKPFWRIRDMFERGLYFAYGCFERNVLKAYLFLVQWENKVLLDYFAVLRDAREQGYGRRALELLQEKLSPKILILESENPEFAKNETDLQIRQKRLHFYHMCRMVDSGLRTRLWGVEYLILYYAQEVISKEEMRIFTEQIYDAMFSKEQKEKYCVIKQ